MKSKDYKIDWLNRYKYALYKVKDLEYTLKTENDISALVLSDIRAEGGHYSLDNVLIRYEEDLEEYKTALEECNTIKREVLDKIRAIIEPNMYRVAYLRYIALLEWDDIADRMHYSKPHIYKMHAQGLDIIEI